MIEEILKNVRQTSSGRKLFTSEQKVYIVDIWESSGLSAPEFCRRYGLFSTQLYMWRKDSQRGAGVFVQMENFTARQSLMPFVEKMMS